MPIQPKEKLKKINNDTLQEANPPEDRSRPLEWHRRLNFTNFSLKEIKIIRNFFVNEVEIELSEKEENSSFDQVKPNPKIVRRISGTVFDCGDKIYPLVKEDGDKSIYHCESTKDATKIEITECEKPLEHKLFPNGVYHGSIFRDNKINEDEKDSFSITCRIPSTHMDEIIRLLSCNTTPTLSLGIEILSFSYEVDDALREYWMPRTMLVEDGAYAILTNISLIEGKASESIIHDLPYEYPENKVSTSSKSCDLEKIVSHVTKVLWVIAAILFFHLFK